MKNFREIFEESFARVSDSNGEQEFYATFYARFLLTHKEVANLFSQTDMNHQFSMLHESLHELVKFSLTHEKTPYLVRLAKIHGAGGHGVSLKLYEYWLGALIDAVREMDPDFSDDVETAWRVVLAPGIAFMMRDSSV